MKFIKTINKNLKLLLRAKSSAFIVVFGPLIIILLVGLALNKPSTYALSIGYYSPDKTNSLTDSFIQEIENNNYAVLKHDSNESCIQTIKQGTAHTCIIFPKNFEIGNEASNKVEFYVDYSRANIVYQIIDTVSTEFELRTTELSRDLTQTLLTKILETKKDIDEDILSIITIKSSIDGVISNIQDTKSKSESLNLSMDTISLSNVKSSGVDLYDDAKDLKNQGLDAVTEGKSLAGNSSTAELEEIEDEIISIYNKTPATYDEFKGLIDNATAKIAAIESNLEASKTKNQEIVSKLDEVKTSLDNLKTNANDVKAKLETTNTNLENIDIASAESIVSPIKTEIKPIVAETNQLIFFFPFLLVLVIMFIGIMLSSALIIMEKSSKAAFRNFITPTKDWFFVITTYVTSFIVLFLQVIVILLLSYYFLKAEIFTNFLLTALIILITMSIFILIGMAIGYVAATQEAATMLSIALGSVFLLLSNLILPIETMSEFIKNLTQFNPYVVSSELLKKTLLFKVSILDSFQDTLFLAGFMIIMISLVFLINKLSIIKLLERSPHIQRKGYIYVPEDAYLKIEGHTIKDKKDILKVLKVISDEEFEAHVKKKNEIADWVSNILKERKLAWKLRFKSKEKMIEAMNNHLDKEKKIEEKRKKKLED